MVKTTDVSEELAVSFKTAQIHYSHLDISLNLNVKNHRCFGRTSCIIHGGQH